MASVQALLLGLAISGLSTSALAAEFQVSPNLSIPIKRFDAPLDEQPFFGFEPRTAAQQKADVAFLTIVNAQFETQEDAVLGAVDAGWNAIRAGDLAAAMRRFNQAWLIDKEHGAVFHGFAVTVFERWDDRAYALELFRLAVKAPRQTPGVLADAGQFMLRNGKDQEARSALEAAIKGRADDGTVWLNLAFARMRTGDGPGACAALVQADDRVFPSRLRVLYSHVKRKAKCL